MASISPLLKFSICISFVGLQLSDPLITLSQQNPNNSLLFTAVQTFLYFLAPLTFILTTLLLPFHMTKLHTKFPILFSSIAMATQALSFATLLLALPLMAISSIPLNQGTEEAIWAVSVCLAAILTHNSLKEHFKLDPVHHGPSFFALSISIASLAFVDQLFSYSHQFQNPLIQIPIQLLIWLQIPSTFFLGLALMFIRIAVPRLLVGRLAMAVQAMGFTTLLMGLYVMVYLGLADVAPIGVADVAVITG